MKGELLLYVPSVSRSLTSDRSFRIRNCFLPWVVSPMFLPVSWMAYSVS